MKGRTKYFRHTSARQDVFDNGKTRQIDDEMRRKRQMHRHMSKKWVANNVEFEYQLYRGEDKFPRIEKLKPYDAGIRNNQLKRDFIKKLDKGEECRMWSWRMVDKSLFISAINKRLAEFES